jgi:uridine kinase
MSYLVGISGGSASGKTYLLERLMNAFSASELTLVSMDHYYRDQHEQVREPDGSVNYDRPDALMLDRFEHDVRELEQGRAVSIREYTFNVPGIEPKMLTFEPAPIVVFEGLFMFYLQSVRERLDLRLFLDADEHIKLSRRIRRDIAERNLSIDEVLDQYEHQVVPSFREFVEPYRFYSDLILPNNRHLEISTQVVVNHLRSVVEKAG